MTRIVVSRDSAVVREVALADRDLRVGRSNDNDIVLEDAGKAVSRVHAELRHEAGGWVLLDLNSQNGIWTNGVRQPRIVLQPGTPVGIGPYQLTLMSEAFDAGETVVQQAPAAATMRTLNETAVFVRPAAAGQQVTGAASAARRDVSAQRSSSAGPVAALLRLPRPVLFGGFVGVAVVAIVLTSMLRPSANADAVDVTPVAEAAPASAPVSAPTPAPDATSTRNELITQQLAAGERALLEGRLDAAIADHLDRVLLVDPQNAPALALKARVQKAIEARAVPAASRASQPPTPAAATSSPRAPAPPGSTPARSTASTRTVKASADEAAAAADAEPPFPRQPGETPTTWRARGRALHQRFTSAESESRRGNYIEAARAFEGILRDEPAYPGARAGLDSARRGLVTEAEALVAEGRAHEDAGRFAEAASVYQRALTVAPTLAEAEARLGAVRGKLQGEAEAAYMRARQYDALKRVQDAIREYEAALAGLARDDRRRSAIDERLAVLKRPPLEERR